RDAAHYPLGLLIEPLERLHLRFGYRPEMFERAAVEDLAAQFVRLIEAFVSTPGRPISSLDILAPADRDRILHRWNDTAREIPETTLPELFEAQVQCTPNASAFFFEESSLSYEELNVRANRLAHLLIRFGIGPESVVAIALDRSTEMIVSLLAVLKSGAAYLP